MMRRTPLRRRPVHARRRDTGPTLKTRLIVWNRDDGQCNRCGYDVHLGQPHHRRLRGMGGSRASHVNCPCNLVTLCPLCHGYVHNQGLMEAIAQGFIVSHYDEPAAVSVMRFSTSQSGVTQRPTCEGGWAA